jgi:hypothetical protein
MNHLLLYGESVRPARLMTFEQFGTEPELPVVAPEDFAHFMAIITAICESHLTPAELRSIGLVSHGMITESWFSDLKDKAQRGVLKVKSDAGRLLTAVAQKAKDVLEFLKSLAKQIGDAVMGALKSTVTKVKGKLVPKQELIGLYSAYMASRGKRLVDDIGGTGRVVAFVFTELPGKIVSALVATLRRVFGEGRNEGFDHFCDGFLVTEDNSAQEEQKSFLQKLGDRVAALPPFSWLPKVEGLMKQGLGVVRDFFARFLDWVDTPEEYSKKLRLKKNPFTKGLRFLFDMLEIYLVYLYNSKVGEKLEAIKKSLQNADNAVMDKLVAQVKSMSLEKVYQAVGITPADIMARVKAIAQKIPYVSSLLSIIEVLGLCLGVYQAVQPLLAKLKPAAGGQQAGNVGQDSGAAGQQAGN